MLRVPTTRATPATVIWLLVLAAVCLAWLLVFPLVLLEMPVGCFEVSSRLGVRACGQQEKIFVGMILMLIFGEALALYGLIVSIVIVTVTGYKC